MPEFSPIRLAWIGTAGLTMATVAAIAVAPDHHHAALIGDFARILAVFAGTAGSCVVARGSTGIRHRAWTLLSMGMLLVLIGHAVILACDLTGAVHYEPLIMDVTAALASPLALAAFLTLSQVRLRIVTRARALVDALIFAISGSMVSWVAVLRPILEATHGGIGAKAAALVAPALLFALATSLIRTAVHIRGPDRSTLRLLAVGAGLAILTSLGYLAITAHEGYVSGTILDGGWVAAFGTFTVATVQARRDARQPNAANDGVGMLQIYLPYIPVALAALAYLAVLIWVGTPDQFLNGCVVAIAALLAIRQLIALRENVALTHDLQQRTADLDASERRYRALVQGSSDTTLVLDPDGLITFASPAVSRVLGFRPEAVTHRSFVSLLHPDDAGTASETILAAADRRGASSAFEVRMGGLDGSWRWMEVVATNLLGEPSVRGIVLNTRDVTDRRNAEAALRHQAFHDPLTGLPNRALLFDRLEHALNRGRRNQQALALIFIDLDDFKLVNDGMGHRAGDAVLSGIGARMVGVVRSADTVARVGGDEFAILLDGDATVETSLAMADRIHTIFDEPIDVDGAVIGIGASVGVAVALGGTATSAEVLLRNADLAMYRAKSEGKGRVATFDSPRVHAISAASRSRTAAAI